jgi:NADH-quinone oxidoreductase subunit M
MTPGLLSTVTFLPAVGAVALALVPRRLDAVHRAGALGVALLTFLVSIPLWIRFDGARADFQFEEVARWVPSLGVSYHVGIDGISLLLVLLTTFLTPIALA